MFFFACVAPAPSSPGFTPSPNVTDFLCSAPVRPVSTAVAADAVAAAAVAAEVP